MHSQREIGVAIEGESSQILQRFKAYQQDREDSDKVIEILNEFLEVLEQREGALKAISKLRRDFTSAQAATPTPEQRVWECIGLFYRDIRRPHQAVQVFAALYDQMISYQLEHGERVHKGMPLVWLHDCHLSLNHPVIAKRYLMLTLCEDAINFEGSIPSEKSGGYFRLAFHHGLPDSEIERYAQEVYQRYTENSNYGQFPEWLLQELDNQWMIEYPTEGEAFVYVPNRHYIRHLLDNLGEGTGQTLERLAQYILDIVPGFRTYRRRLAKSTDYDVVCAVEGTDRDFRSQLGRYFLCECKDWDDPADFTAMAKFCRVLDSAKCKAGILFSKGGISGEDETKYAEREQLKIFQDRGVVILVVNHLDLKALSRGFNFLVMLRNKYEKIRLDLVGK